MNVTEGKSDRKLPDEGIKETAVVNFDAEKHVKEHCEQVPHKGEESKVHDDIEGGREIPGNGEKSDRDGGGQSDQRKNQSNKLPRRTVKNFTKERKGNNTARRGRMLPMNRAMMGYGMPPSPYMSPPRIGIPMSMHPMTPQREHNPGMGYVGPHVTGHTPYWYPPGRVPMGIWQNPRPPPPPLPAGNPYHMPSSYHTTNKGGYLMGQGTGGLHGERSTVVNTSLSGQNMASGGTNISLHSIGEYGQPNGQNNINQYHNMGWNESGYECNIVSGQPTWDYNQQVRGIIPEDGMMDRSWKKNNWHSHEFQSNTLGQETGQTKKGHLTAQGNANVNSPKKSLTTNNQTSSVFSGSDNRNQSIPIQPQSSHNHPASGQIKLQAGHELENPNSGHGQVLTDPLLGKNYGLTNQGGQHIVPSYGHQQTLPSHLQQQTLPSHLQQQTLPNHLQQQTVSSHTPQQSVSSHTPQQSVSSHTPQQSIQNHGTNQIIASNTQQKRYMNPVSTQGPGQQTNSGFVGNQPSSSSPMACFPQFGQHPLSQLVYQLALVDKSQLTLFQPPEASFWYYVDMNQTIQGPYDTLKMLQWFIAGYFRSETMVRRGDESNFQKLDNGSRLFDVGVQILAQVSSHVQSGAQGVSLQPHQNQYSRVHWMAPQ